MYFGIRATNSPRNVAPFQNLKNVAFAQRSPAFSRPRWRYRPQPPAIQSDHTSRAGARGLGAAGRINPISRPLRRRRRRRDRDESVRRGSRGTFLACGQ